MMLSKQVRQRRTLLLVNAVFDAMDCLPLMLFAYTAMPLHVRMPAGTFMKMAFAKSSISVVAEVFASLLAFMRSADEVMRPATGAGCDPTPVVGAPHPPESALASGASSPVTMDADVELLAIQSTGTTGPAVAAATNMSLSSPGRVACASTHKQCRLYTSPLHTLSVKLYDADHRSPALQGRSTDMVMEELGRLIAEHSPVPGLKVSFHNTCLVSGCVALTCTLVRF
eukprot:363879-Chlamydomonas_euryale.AAC.8